MNFYECLQLQNWKRLTDEEKTTIFAGVLKFFVKPGLSIDWQQLVTFEMCGMKCQTFEIMLSGEKYVFIPGQKEVVLGWDFGSQGLKSHELIDDESSHLSDDKNQFKTSLTGNDLAELEKEAIFESSTYDFSQLTEIDRYINEYTSPLRKVEVEPMLVAKNSQPVGTSIRGKYNSVSGQFFGEEQFWDNIESEVTKRFRPNLSIKESLNWEYPKSILKKDHYYLEQLASNPDHYHVFAHRSLTYGELWLLLHQQGVQLLPEDAWEYAVGGGTRRLFRWGNQLDLASRHPFSGVGENADAPNMFGIEIDTNETHYELTDNSSCLKLEKRVSQKSHLIERVLPFSSYYRSAHSLDVTQLLLPNHYHFRKSIRIDPN